MAKSFEDMLRSFAFATGKVVERVIDEAKISANVEGRRGLKPILSLESQLSFDMIQKLTLLGEDKIVRDALPATSEKTMLEIGEGSTRFVQEALRQGAIKACGVELDEALEGRKQGDVARGFIVKGSLFSLPLPEESFDVVLACLATPLQGHLPRALKEIARVIIPGGQGLLLDYHPYGLYTKRNGQHSKNAQSHVRGMEDYYKMLRMSGLRVVDIREAFLEEDMRNLFREEDIGAYRRLKGTPLLLGLVIYKPKRKDK